MASIPFRPGPPSEALLPNAAPIRDRRVISTKQILAAGLMEGEAESLDSFTTSFFYSFFGSLLCFRLMVVMDGDQNGRPHGDLEQKLLATTYLV